MLPESACRLWEGWAPQIAETNPPIMCTEVDAQSVRVRTRSNMLLLYNVRHRIDGASLNWAEALGFLTLSDRTLMATFATSSILDAKVSIFSLAKLNGLMLVWWWRQTEFVWAVMLNLVVYVHMGLPHSLHSWSGPLVFFFIRRPLRIGFVKETHIHCFVYSKKNCSAYKIDWSLDIYHDNSDLPLNVYVKINWLLTNFYAILLKSPCSK